MLIHPARGQAAVEALVLSELEKVVADGLPADAVEASLNTIEFGLREASQDPQIHNASFHDCGCLCSTTAMWQSICGSNKNHVSLKLRVFQANAGGFPLGLSAMFTAMTGERSTAIPLSFLTASFVS